MTIDYVLGAIVTVGLLIYLVFALIRPERILMTFNGWLQIAIFAAIVILITKPFGGYMTRVFNGERTFLRPVLRWLEVGIYKLCGVREDEEQHWVTYAVAMLAFSFAGFVIMYAIQRLQNVLPLNPAGKTRCRLTSRSTPRSAS